MNMVIWPIVLRILLAVGLVLNGSGYAAASAHLGIDRTNAAHSLPGSTQSDAATCHEQVPASDPAHRSADPSGMAHAIAWTGSQSPSPERCESGDCGCACAQQAAAAVIAALHTGGTVIGRNHGARTMVLGHPSPALPQLIRPPIG